MKAQPQAIESFPDQTVLSAWREQLAQAPRTPAVRQRLLFGQHELLPKFGEQYQRLKVLPRHMRRGLQRKWKRSLAGVALLLALGQAPALAATISVGGGCILVDAITAANTNNAIGGCRAGRGADTIVLPANSTQTLTAVNNGYVGPSGLPVVTSAITIAGNGSTIARSTAAGTPAFRIFIVGAGGNLTLRQTTISGGLLQSDSRGGGVYRRSGRLTLAGCTISGNTAYLGGGVANAVAGTLTVTNSTISGNKAIGNQGGGGVFNNGPDAKSGPGTLIVTNSTISGNTAKFAGGVRNDGIAILTDSTISGNTSFTRGGGVANARGSLALTNSTISYNTARYDGGGVLNYQGTITLTNSTVSRNVAGNRGSGLYNSFGRMFLTNSTIAVNGGGGAQTKGGGVFSGGRVGNLRSDVILNRTLISGNFAGFGAEIFQVDGGVVTANNFNLFGRSDRTNATALSGFIISGASDITATSDGTAPAGLLSILNQTLANNGGSTETHALIPGSPAVDAVTTGCPPPANDQRGVPRPQDGNNDGIALCDIGAFELAP